MLLYLPLDLLSSSLLLSLNSILTISLILSLSRVSLLSLLSFSLAFSSSSRFLFLLASLLLFLLSVYQVIPIVASYYKRVASRVLFTFLFCSPNGWGRGLRDWLKGWWYWWCRWGRRRKKQGWCRGPRSRRWCSGRGRQIKVWRGRYRGWSRS